MSTSIPGGPPRPVMTPGGPPRPVMTPGGPPRTGMIPGGPPRPGMTPGLGIPPSGPPSNPGMSPSNVPSMSRMPPASGPPMSAMPPSGPPTNSGMSPLNGSAMAGMPPASGPPMSAMPPSGPPAKSGMPPSNGLPMSGIPPSGPPTNSGMPPASGLAMSGMPPASGLPMSGMPPSGPPSKSGPPSNGPLMSGMLPSGPPSSSGMPPSNGPPISGMPPASGPPISGMPPSEPPSKTGMPPSNRPPMMGMPPSGAPFNGPPMSRMPPASGPLMSGMPPASGTPMSGMPPSGPPSNSGMPPSNGPPMLRMPPASGPPMSGMPPSGPPSNRPPMSRMPPASGPLMSGMPTASGPPMSGMPPSGPPSNSGMPPSNGHPMSGMPPASGPPMSGMPPASGPPMSGISPASGPPMSGMPGAQYVGASNGYHEPARRTLDPDQMPSPIQVMDDDQQANGGYFDTKEKGLTPPLVSTNFTVRDYGNASPRYIRSTMYNVPSTPDLLKQSSVPFGLVLSPFAPVEENEIEPPLSDFGPSGPVRCVRCKAYMCPFMQFIDGGRRFQCVFCKATTDVPQEYFQHLDHTGLRLDHYQRPELCLGAYEVVATKDYCRESKEPNTPGIIFAIDVSYPMIKEGIVQLICENMKSLLKNLPRDMHCDKAKPRVGFMTYDSKAHFYNINSGLSQPQQLSVGDVTDMFVPLVEGFLVDVEKAEAVIDSLVEQIPQMFGDTRETETILGPVIQAGKEAFKAAECAGKLIVFHHNLPVSEAPGKLKNRDDRKVLGTEKEKSVLMPQNKFYNELGQECVGVGCSVDLFLFNNAYIDVATLSQVCRLSGGQVYKYTYFQAANDGERFLKDLEHNLSRPIVFDAIMRVRTSTGVRPVDFYGSFYMANTTDTELASMNSDSAVACEIKHDDKITEEDGVYIQAAILFTSSSGQRRLRILNLALNTSSNLADMYRNCELDTVINFTAKQSISKLMETNPKTVKDNLVSNCANILACYRKNCASPSSAGQLILPECMKLLPLYTNCLVKSDALSGGADVGCDDRAYLMSIVSSMDVKSSVTFFYPRLFPIHDVNPSDYGNGILPDQIRCTIEKIRDDGVYLLENGIYMFMYIGLAVDPVWVQDVFGVQSVAQINLDQPSLQKLDNPVSRRVNEIVNTLRDQNSKFLRLVLIRQREKLDVLFRHYLVEDRTGNNDANFSYVDFLCHMHKEIRVLLG